VRNGVACFWATSLEEIIAGVIAIISLRPRGWMQQSAVPKCAHRRHRAVKRRDYRPNLRAAGSSADGLQFFGHVAIGGATEVMTGAQASRTASRRFIWASELRPL